MVLSLLKGVWVLKVGVSYVLLLVSIFSGYLVKILLKMNIVYVDVWKIWLDKKFYDSDVLFVCVNGICVVIWIKNIFLKVFWLKVS